jgi:hypothetical protein
MEAFDADTPSLPAPAMSRAERTLRRKFVAQYMVDYDAVDACIRLGYRDPFAKQYAQKFLEEPYTRQLIAEEEAKLGLDELKKHKIAAVAGLYREARSPLNTGAARVAAWAMLAKITGMEAPTKVQQVLPQVGNADLAELEHEDLKALEKILGKVARPDKQASPDAS